MKIFPIRSDEDHAKALRLIEKHWGAASGTREGDMLDVMITLVERYEDERWPSASGDPVEILNYAISDMGRSQKELGDVIGSRPRASEVLSRRRPLTLEMIRKISSAWNIPANLLISQYELAPAA